MTRFVAFLCVFGLLIVGVMCTERTHFWVLMAFYSGAFGLYYFKLMPFFERCDVSKLLVLALLVRLILCGFMPLLSNDYTRFLWDGRLLAQFQNPYLVLPSLYIKNHVGNAELNALFLQLNSPNYHTVYPPVCQYIFGSGTFLFADNVFLNILWQRFWLILGDGLAIFSIYQLGNKNTRFAALYAFNPLILIEITGNLHHEGLMLGGWLFAFCCLKQNHYKPTFWVLMGSALSLALAVCVKLLPLITLPFLVRQIGFWRMVFYSCAVFLFSIILFLPFFDVQLAANLMSSIGLYFQKFEFNASLYYLVRTLGYWLVGYNPIGIVGKFFLLLSAGFILFFALRKRPAETLFNQIFLALMAYFLLATTVHPWYIGSVLAFSILAKNRLGIVWSLLVFLSYSTYETMPYKENLYLVTLEYVVLLFFLVKEYIAHQKNTRIANKNK